MKMFVWHEDNVTYSWPHAHWSDQKRARTQCMEETETAIEGEYEGIEEI